MRSRSPASSSRSGTIVYQEDAPGTQTEIDATPGGLATDPSIKLVVLVDGNTASAAEILAGALQARGRAPLIGTKTYGKGVVQEWLPLPNNDGGIHLTVARWLTPAKVWIQGKGLRPDIAATNGRRPRRHRPGPRRRAGGARLPGPSPRPPPARLRARAPRLPPCQPRARADPSPARARATPRVWRLAVAPSAGPDTMPENERR